MVNRRLHNLLPIAFLALAAGCSSGGSGGSGGGQPPGSGQPPPQIEPSYVSLSSDSGDPVGNGQTYDYTNANAEITVKSSFNRLTIAVHGDERWNGEFELPDSYSELQQGSYSDAQQYPLQDASVAGMNWWGFWGSCNSVTGWIIIDSVTYDGATLTGIDFQFEQHCDGNAAALHGEIHWDANDTTSPPGPVSPPPAGLWTPAPGATPASGNYIYLESESGDYVGVGDSYLYTLSDALILVNASDGRLSVSVNGDEKWFGDFQTMSSLTRLDPGYYGDLRWYPGSNPARGGLSWHGEGRSCGTATGWFVVDHVTYEGTELQSIDLRFEQHCEGDVPALHGKIHWDTNEMTTPDGPVVPPPAGLWEPAAGATPASGTYIYLESEPGDYIGDGGTYLYTQANSIFDVIDEGSRMRLTVEADESLAGTFQAMDSLSRLEVGYYGELQRYPFHNPAKGGMTFSRDGRNCATLTGWFVVDSVTYDGMNLVAIDLRFEQYCNGGSAALHGEIHWDANDPTTPPGPVSPPPTGLWEPAAGATPTSGNYVYLESQPGDWVGAGFSYLYTDADAITTVDSDAGNLWFTVSGDEKWTGSFTGMYFLSRLEAGYYGDLDGSPIKGGVYWYGEGRGCGVTTGWFVIDSVTYDGTTLTAFDLRFEQSCDGSTAVLHGAIHWDANDVTSPPGPVVPPPAGLWDAAPGTTPASGNYIYLESETGDLIGEGNTYLYTDANAQSRFEMTDNLLDVTVAGAEDWHGFFKAMDSLSRLEVGYYGDLLRYMIHNPAKGGLDWTGEGRSCSTLTGWFVVDSVTYDAGNLAAIDLRFEQHCKGGTPALHGKIHWNAADVPTPGPLVPPPAGLWAPAAGVTPTSGNYVYLESEQGDYVGQGQTYLFTPGDATILVDAQGNLLSFDIADGEWTGDFQTMENLTQFEAGYYGDLERYPFHDPTRGGLDWSGEGRGCNTVSGWFVVDTVAYVGTTLTAIDLRFEQQCEGVQPPLHGAIHWVQ
jgi:hypothetical protein